MSDNQTLKSPGRRNFFRKAGVGIGAAGAVAAGLSAVPVRASDKASGNTGESAYRETEHVKKAYETARF